MIGWMLRVLFFLLALPGAANAACRLTATDIKFPSVNTLSAANTESSGEITVSCDPLSYTSISMTISVHDGAGGVSGSTRLMKSGATTSSLGYQLYKDSAHTQVLGPTGGGTAIILSGASLTSLLTGTEAKIKVFGRVTGGQSSVKPGSYISAFNRGSTDVSVEYYTCLLFACSRPVTETFTFNVTAEVSRQCSVTATALGFGAVGLLSANVDGASQINVRCTAGTAYAISLGYGLVGTGPMNRYLRNAAGARIRYGLYSDAARSIPWGTLADAVAQPSTGSGSSSLFDVYGRVPPQTTPVPGLYSDAVAVTITY